MKEHRLKNSNGICVVLDEMGASVRKVQTIDRTGRFSNIALCPSVSDGKLSLTAYAGATLGPAAGRVPHGELWLEGRRFQLSVNEGKHHLHGGARSLADEMWRCESAGDTQARFACELEAGRDGYPGNRRFSAEYTLSETNRLTLRLQAESDAPTWVSLSNHLYWNLSGDFSKTVGEHRLQLSASRVYRNDSEHIPVECLPVEGTLFDFRNGAALGERMAGNDPQLAIAQGYNHLFLLEGKKPAAVLSHAASGRVVSLYTDFPTVMFYTGGYLGPSLALEGGGYVCRNGALALEPQLLPMTRFSREASAVTGPGQPFDHWIAYQFDVEAR